MYRPKATNLRENGYSREEILTRLRLVAEQELEICFAEIEGRKDTYLFVTGVASLVPAASSLTMRIQAAEFADYCVHSFGLINSLAYTEIKSLFWSAWLSKAWRLPLQITLSLTFILLTPLAVSIYQFPGIGLNTVLDNTMLDSISAYFYKQAQAFHKEILIPAISAKV
jgi:hypothetical protein